MSTESSGDWLDGVSVQVLTENQRWARLTGLSLANKQIAWSEINRLRPALALLLKDPQLHEIAKFFDAEIYVETESVPSLPTEYLKGRRRD